MSDLKQQNIHFGQGTAIIAVGETISSIIDTAGNVITGLIAPSDFTGISLTLLVGATEADTTHSLGNADGSTFALNVLAGNAVIIIPQFVAGWRFIKFVANTNQLVTPSNLIVFGRPI